MGRFTDKVALVTGAGSGLGAAIADRLAHDGALVIAADVSGRQDEVAAELGGEAVGRHVDVSDHASVVALERWVRSTFGGLDILANNAGIGGPVTPLHEYPIDAFDRIMSVNLRGAYLMLQAGIRLMRQSGGGAVVNTASIDGIRAAAGSSAYVVSKGAVVMMTRVAALEYAQESIRVNAVAPGTIRTPILDNWTSEGIDFLRSQVPQGRLGEPSDVANLVAFLADDRECGHVTGQVWLVDGGRSAG